jgi:predicted ABC-type transport system involved in lysophospholipase L1 biosynthesis ATPase subunit
MPFALELRGLVKRFHAGAGSCRASLAVLRGIDLTLEPSELVAVTGARGAGTSTLLLCAAGLLLPDAGEIAWFGKRPRAGAVERARYIAASVPNRFKPPNVPPASITRSAVARRVSPILLVDAPFGLDAMARAWLARRRTLGDAILLATRAEALVARDADRVLQLRDGLLHSEQTASARVAERVWRGAARVR